MYIILEKRKLKFSDDKCDFASCITHWQAVAMKCATPVSVDGSLFAGSTAVPFCYMNPAEEFKILLQPQTCHQHRITMSLFYM